MDEILDQFVNTLTTEVQDDKDFKSLYKIRGKFYNQEERRQEILEKQKSDRNYKLDTNRGILQLIESAKEECSTQTHYKPSNYVAGFTKHPPVYKNVLMLSEWFVEKPEDLNTNWYVTPCPKFPRMLAVATRGKTKYYNKYGCYKFENQSLLPGGNHQEKRQRYSVIDCFVDHVTKTVYIMDVLAWNNQSMTDGELEFRQYWLQSKFAEEPRFGKISKLNEYAYRLLPITSYDPVTFQRLMMTYPMMESVNIDGLLFMHKAGHYEAGETPLVGWLFPFMVPEILGLDIRIHEQYAAKKPVDYVDQVTYIKKFDEELKKKRYRRNTRRSRDSEMADQTQKQAKQPDKCSHMDSTE